MRLKTLAEPALKNSVLMKGYFLLKVSKSRLMSSVLVEVYQTSDAVAVLSLDRSRGQHSDE
jgi:hypothetical protein